MRTPLPALLLLATAAIVGVAGSDRSGHVHRGTAGQPATYHRHAHLLPHGHATADSGHGGRHGHPAAPGAGLPPLPGAPPPEVPSGDGYYQAPSIPPIPTTPPALPRGVLTRAAPVAFGVLPAAEPAGYSPFQPRPPPA